MERQIVLVAHNLRSSHNVGSLLRTADGLGIKQVLLTGYTPYPQQENDSRMPHIVRKVTNQIHKTALGSEESVNCEHFERIDEQIVKLKSDGFEVIALEQTPNSIALPDYKPSDKVAIVVGREVEGIETEVLALANTHVEIPMLGKKESYNVSVAAGMALYHLRFN